MAHSLPTSIAEVARYVLLRSAQRDLINPRVQPLQLLVIQCDGHFEYNMYVHITILNAKVQGSSDSLI